MSEMKTDPEPVPSSSAGSGELKSAQPESEINKSFAVLSIAVLGVVYGDIGTSPIYAMRETFAGKHPIPVTPDNVLGILSLIFWSLVMIISLKYMMFVLRADNHGEGGIFALLALLRPDAKQDRRTRRWLILLGILGASMLYGGAMITPAISVLSAVEGLRVAEPMLGEFVIPITIAILGALFAVQRHGTAKVGAIFGPLTLIWFVVLGILGVRGILQQPQVLIAINPVYAVTYFMNNGLNGYLALYGVFLVTTGGEALYADLGHFGRIPIRRVWFAVVLPALLLNYFGQGALMISDPTESVHPFFHLAPEWALYPLIFLAAAATCIASQAVITGVYSLTRQAMQLNLMPRFTVEQTSADVRGQIYMPGVNWALMIAAIGLVLLFQTSGNLAAAYGVAVNSTMAITTVLAFRVARERGGWNWPSALAFLLAFIIIDLGYLGSNLMTIPEGGWLPLVIGLVLFSVMTTWRRGSIIVSQLLAKTTTNLETFIGRITAESISRVAGAAVFFTDQLDDVPPALQQFVVRTGVLHETVILISVIIEPVPKIAPDERIEITQYDAGFVRLVLHYGYMQGTNVPSDLALCAEHGLQVNMETVNYFIGHVNLLAGRKQQGMAYWRDRLFVRMAVNTEDATASYLLPHSQTMNIGLFIGI
jgi:KUP system potassium uptake protein